MFTGIPGTDTARWSGARATRVVSGVNLLFGDLPDKGDGAMGEEAVGNRAKLLHHNNKGKKKKKTVHSFPLSLYRHFSGMMSSLSVHTDRKGWRGI